MALTAPIEPPVGGGGGDTQVRRELCFQGTFAACRNAFLDAACALPRDVTRVYSLAPLHGKLGPHGEPLCTDVCAVDLSEAQVRALAEHAAPFRAGVGRALSSARASSSEGPCTLLHTSGVHGVEGYTGSAVQVALLQRLNILLRLAGMRSPGRARASLPRVVPVAEEGEPAAEDVEGRSFFPLFPFSRADGPGRASVPVVDSVPLRLTEELRALAGEDSDKARAALLRALESARSAEGAGERLRPSDDACVRLVFVHSLNPSGHALGRRWTSRNVDLNRNFLSNRRSAAALDELARVPPAQAAATGATAYAKIASLVNPPLDVDVEEGAWFWPRAGLAIAQHGYSTLKQAVAGGQRTFATGLWYGGVGRTPERVVMEAMALHEDILRSPFGLARYHAEDLEGPAGPAARGTLVHVDVHTGLGPVGMDSLLANDAASCDWVRDIVGIPPSAEDGLAPGDRRVQNTSEGTKTVAFVIEGDCNGGIFHMAGARHDAVVSFTQEFGTVTPIEILVALRRENARFHRLLEERGSWDRVSGPDIDAQRDAVRRAFLSDAPEWRDSVLLRGVRVADDAVGFLLGLALKARGAAL
jgi:hypothetical protein